MSGCDLKYFCNCGAPRDEYHNKNVDVPWEEAIPAHHKDCPIRKVLENP